MTDPLKPDLKYNSVEEWVLGEGVPEGFVKLEDEKLRNKYITEYGELRRHLFAQHVTTLPEAEQKKLDEGTHPSQSHAFAEDAEPYRQTLCEHLKSFGLEPLKITLGFYHCDRIVLSVDVEESIGNEKLKKRPWLFQGFEVFYHPEQPTKNELM